MAKKPQPQVDSRTIKRGGKLLSHETDASDNWQLPGEMVTVEEMTRTKIVIRHEDGSKTVYGY